MKTIWKFVLDKHEEILKLPKDYKILSIIEQDNCPILYCIVNPDNEKIDVKFSIFGTGWDLPEHIDNLEFLGSVSVYSGVYIWHIFKDKE